MEELTDKEKRALLIVLTYGMNPLMLVDKGKFFQKQYEEDIYNALHKIGISDRELDRLYQEEKAK